jgi:hypothetical protein
MRPGCNYFLGRSLGLDIPVQPSAYQCVWLLHPATEYDPDSVTSEGYGTYPSLATGWFLDSMEQSL